MPNFPTSLPNLKTDYDNNDAIASADQNLPNDEINAMAAKVGINSSADQTSHDYKLSGITGANKAFSTGNVIDEDNMASNLDTKVPTQQSVKAYADTKMLAPSSPAIGDLLVWNGSVWTKLAAGALGKVLVGMGAGVLPSWNEFGWLPDANTWTRTGNHTFTIAGDFTSIYTKGTKIRYKDGGSFEYGIVASSSYAAPNTTVNLVPNNDYAMAAATITETYYSYVDTPYGFPDWFAYTPTHTGFSADPTVSARFTVKGKTVILKYDVSGAGTSNATGYTVSAPITSANTNSIFVPGYGVDNVTETAVLVKLAANSSTINIYKGTSASGTWTNSGNKYAYFVISYEI